FVIGDGLGGAGSDVVRLDSNGQIGSSSPPLITESGLLQLNNVSQTVPGLAITGGQVTTGTGTLFLLGDVTTNASAQTATIGGNLALAAATPISFNVANGAA